MRTLRFSLLLTPVLAATLLFPGCQDGRDAQRPNFLILMSDNHSWNHLGCYGDPAVKTPHIDRIAEQGIRFTHAFCAAPSCTPARAAMLTGQEIWRLEEGANLWGTLPAKFPVYPDMLEASGYLVGHAGKGWGPGNYEAGGWKRNPAGDRYDAFDQFLAKRAADQPFCYWFSSPHPHRPYRGDQADDALLDRLGLVHRPQGQEQAGAPEVDTAAINVPKYLPDAPEVRGDIADYYGAVEVFDGEVARHMEILEASGLAANTLVIVCSDNGWQMPRGLANLYDFGTRIPLIISMPERLAGGRVVDAFVNLNDLAPTMLELAGLAVPDNMTAKSLVPVLKGDGVGSPVARREFMVTALERHAFCRRDGVGYPARAIRTKDHLYIRNYEPGRWPAGDPPLYGDVDAHMLHYPCPTKMLLLTRRDEPGIKPLFELGFAKRPAEELYDLRTDPDQMHNVAGDPQYQDVKARLAEQLTAYLKATGDPRETGGEMKWLSGYYFAEDDKRPRPGKDAIEKLGLAEQYSYID